MNPVDLNPVQPEQRRQSAFDLFLIFAGANIVATTLQTGASLAPSFRLPSALALILAGSVGGSLLIAVLSRLGPRLGVPSIIAARAALGLRGAGLVAFLLYVTNFAWIAVNNVIAASACAQVMGGPASLRAWSVALGVLATVIVAGGPRLVALADRLAVPLLLVVGAVVTVAVLRLPPAPLAPAAGAAVPWFRGLDIVVGYQVSWILMFADYSRYTPSERRAGIAVFLGLALTSVWMMPLGYAAARAAGSTDPGLMLKALNLGAWGAVLMTVATVTTNFVNIYMSALAIRSLWPWVGSRSAVWTTGLLGAGLSLFSGGWLDRYANLMLVLGGILVPVGAVLLARFFLVAGRDASPRRPQHAGEGRDASLPVNRGFHLPGMAAWLAGGATYYATGSIGSTLPALIVAVGVYWMLNRPD